MGHQLVFVTVLSAGAVHKAISTKPLQDRTGKMENASERSGKGIDDEYIFPCSAGNTDTFSSENDVLITNPNSVQSYSVYSKKPESVQVILDGKCSVKNYTTSNGKTSATSYSVVGAACDVIKKEHPQRLQKWEEERFPPCFPFCGRTNRENYNPNPYVGSVNRNTNVWTPLGAGYMRDSNIYIPQFRGNSNPYTLPARGPVGESGYYPGRRFEHYRPACPRRRYIPRLWENPGYQF